jgi:plastocyanin
VSVGAGASSAIVTGLANDTPTTFTVAAVNDVGTGPPSAPSASVIPTAGGQGAATTIPPGSGGEASTAGAGGATAADPFTTTVTVPPTAGGGVITVVESAGGSPPPGGLYEVLGQSVQIVSTASTSDMDPLTLLFVLDESLVRGAFGLGPTDPLPDPASIDITRAAGGGGPAVVPGCLSLGGGGAPIDPSPTCIAERVYDAGLDLRITVLSAAASTWGAVMSPARVKVTDKRFEPASTSVGLGDVVIWSFEGSRPHTVTESVGLGPSKAPLFHSGTRTTGRYGRTFDAAGTFSYRSAIKADPSSMTGTVAVPVMATPARGGPATTFAIRWATSTLAGYASEVQVRFRKAGAGKWSGWSTWQAAAAAGAGTFVADRGVGDYAFRARRLNTTTGKASAWSPEVSIRVE